MEYIKSYFLKVVMLFIVLFSLTTGCLENLSALELCEYGLNIHFGLDKPLLRCVKEAIRVYRKSVLPIDQKNLIPYANDVNIFYWTIYKLVSAVNIELKEQFCGRLGEMPEKLTREENPNSEECESRLTSFENYYPKKMIYAEDTYDYQEIVDAQISPQDHEKKKRILYNALYFHEMTYNLVPRGRHIYGTYEAAYLIDIANKVVLIDADKDFTPRRYCNERHTPEEIDVGTSIPS